jgi:hypothetical protein
LAHRRPTEPPQAPQAKPHLAGRTPPEARPAASRLRCGRTVTLGPPRRRRLPTVALRCRPLAGAKRAIPLVSQGTSRSTISGSRPIFPPAIRPLSSIGTTRPRSCRRSASLSPRPRIPRSTPPASCWSRAIARWRNRASRTDLRALIACAMPSGISDTRRCPRQAPAPQR